MKFEVRNKGTARNFVCDSPWACISISTHEGEWPELKGIDNRVGVLRVAFADVANPNTDGIPKEAIFNHEMAGLLLNFYNLMEQQGVEVMMIHCEAGISRSAGVAAALSKIHEGDDSYYFSSRGPYLPNSLVYRRMLEVHYTPENMPELSEPEERNWMEWGSRKDI